MRLVDVGELIERISRNDDLPWNLDKVLPGSIYFLSKTYENCL